MAHPERSHRRVRGIAGRNVGRGFGRGDPGSQPPGPAQVSILRERCSPPRDPARHRALRSGERAATHGKVKTLISGIRMANLVSRVLQSHVGVSLRRLGIAMRDLAKLPRAARPRIPAVLTQLSGYSITAKPMRARRQDGQIVQSLIELTWFLAVIRATCALPARRLTALGARAALSHGTARTDDGRPAHAGQKTVGN